MPRLERGWGVTLRRVASEDWHRVGALGQAGAALGMLRGSVQLKLRGRGRERGTRGAPGMEAAEVSETET